MYITGLQNDKYTLTFLFFALLFLKSFCQKPLKGLANFACLKGNATLVRPIETPYWDARWNATLARPSETPCWDARMERHFGPPIWDAISKRQNETPLWSAYLSHQSNPPAQNSQAGHGPLAAPPPPSAPGLCNREERGGGGGRPSPPEHPKQVLLLSFPVHGCNYTCFIYAISYIFNTERI